jgi:choline transport protein
MIQGLIILNNPNYKPKNYHGTLLAWAVIAVSVFVNTVVAGLLPVLEGIILFLHVLGFIAILITLVYLSPHSSVEDVFFRSLNEGHWPTQGLSYCVGFIGNVATFVGKCTQLLDVKRRTYLITFHHRRRCGCSCKYLSYYTANSKTDSGLME